VGAAQAEDEGLEPTKEWVKDLVDEVIADEFGSPDLELLWLDEDSGAAEIEAQFEARVKIGAATLNELRDALGLDRFANPAADRPMVLTPTGYVPIEAGGGGNASPLLGTRSAKSQSGAGALSAYQKAAVDDPEHPGWPAGTPDSKGGQFRPKDDESGAQYAANDAENNEPANENRTPEQTCRRAYADSIANTGLYDRQAEYLRLRIQAFGALNRCLGLANGEEPRSTIADYVQFPGGGVVIFRPGRPPIYARPSTQ
jgi:hypothetical protein